MYFDRLIIEGRRTQSAAPVIDSDFLDYNVVSIKIMLGYKQIALMLGLFKERKKIPFLELSTVVANLYCKHDPSSLLFNFKQIISFDIIAKFRDWLSKHTCRKACQIHAIHKKRIFNLLNCTTGIVK